MGIYYWCAVYYGLMVSSEMIAQLREHPLMLENPEMLKKMTHQLNKNQWLLHGPDMLKKIGWMDEILEPHERAAGVVQWDQIQKYAGEWSSNARSEEVDKFRTLASILTSNTNNTVGYYVIQAMWSTLDAGALDQLDVTHNLSVVNAPPL
jgi:hypothetical protein